MNKNIFDDIPDKLPDELTEVLTKSDNVRIERIISDGQTSPENFWYNQEQNEWVIVLEGKAKLLFKENDKLVSLGKGDYINIPAGTEHRVEWTEPENKTIWLAVFYK